MSKEEMSWEAVAMSRWRYHLCSSSVNGKELQEQTSRSTEPHRDNSRKKGSVLKCVLTRSE